MLERAYIVGNCFQCLNTVNAFVISCVAAVDDGHIKPGQKAIQEING